MGLNFTSLLLRERYNKLYLMAAVPSPHRRKSPWMDSRCSFCYAASDQLAVIEKELILIPRLIIRQTYSTTSERKNERKIILWHFLFLDPKIYATTLRWFSYLEQYVQFWVPQHRKDIIKMLKCLPHAERLGEFDMSSVRKR